MKKIITAIGNESINNELKKEKNINIILNDIQYKEGIIEILEEKNEVDYIIINNILQGEIKIEDLIKQIYIINKSIKIIIVIENNEKEIEKYLNYKNIYKIIYLNKNDKINIQKIIEIINNNKDNNYENKNITNKIKQEKNEKNKNLFKTKKENESKNNIEKSNKIKSNKNRNKKILLIKKTAKNIIDNHLIKILNSKKIKLNSKKSFQNKIKNKTFSITGPPGVGKTIISINLAKINAYKNNKILIIDSDFFNNSINTILGLKNISKNANTYIEKINNEINNKYSKNNFNNIFEYFNIIKINKKIDLLILKKEKIREKIEENNENIFLNKIIENINFLKEMYELIIIDINYNKKTNYIKNIIEICDFCLFISDTNLLEINKSIKLLDIYINKLNIKINKIKIIFNKYNSESINFNLLKNIFSEFNVIGKLNYRKIYNKLINKNNKYNLLDKKLKKEYIDINNKLNNI